MHEIKDSKQATVRIGYDGKVHKHYHGPKAKERFLNEVKMLKYLEERNCDFVPQVIDSDEEKLYLITSNCGEIVNAMRPEKQKTLF